MPPKSTRENASAKPEGQKRAGESLGPAVNKKSKTSYDPATKGKKNDASAQSRQSQAKNGPSDNQLKNKQKIWAARTVPAQYNDAALKDGELDVQAFVNSRGFEIKALDESMRRSRATRTSRAFQQVPFTMRRRAAAHNHKRVPKRLQNKARKEMREDNTPTVNSQTKKPASTRARIRAETALRLGKLAEKKRRQKLLKKGNLDKTTIETRAARTKIKRNTLNEPVVTVRKFKKRQINKTWLPTHLWHAKRATMTQPLKPVWGFAIPKTPSQKCYRPTHRIQWEKGAMAWDTSYMSTIGLCGAPESVQHVLKSLGLTREALWNEKGQVWRSGAVQWTGTLSKKTACSVRNIGPAIIVWNPDSASEAVDTAETMKKSMKRLFIRIHPSCFLETFEELKRLVKGQNPRPYIEDLRYEIGSIEITGPESTEALLGTLKPYPRTETKESHVLRFESLLGLGDPASLPSGALLAFSILDPRLQYPPITITKPKVAVQNTQFTILDTKTWYKTDGLKPIDLFNRGDRFQASKLPSQKSLGRRKSKSAPGTFLEPTDADPAIPIMLLASRPPSNSITGTREASKAGTWILLLPWKCVNPVWHSLMHYPLSTGGNPAFGGLDEKKQLAFEHGLPWFPGDFPGTDAGMTWELEQREIRKKAWDRIPQGKRANYETLDLGVGRKGEIGGGWNCDYETLLGLHSNAADSKEADSEKPKDADEDADADTTMTGTADDEPGKDSKKASSQARHPLASITHLSKSLFNAYVAPKSAPLPPAAIITIHIDVLGRGVAETCARIYRLPVAPRAVISTQAEVPATEPQYFKASGKLPADLRNQWLSKLPSKRLNSSKTKSKPQPKHNSSADLNLETRKRLLAQELIGTSSQSSVETINGHPLCPDEEDLIGFVTAGSFNLRNGRPEAIATLFAQKVVEDLKRSKEKVCVVRNSGESVGFVARWDLVG